MTGAFLEDQMVYDYIEHGRHYQHGEMGVKPCA